MKEHHKSGTITLWLVEDESWFAKEFMAELSEYEDLTCERHFITCEELYACAVKLRPSQGPDAILMDIRLPGDSGIAGARKLKERWPDIPIIMLTNDDQPDVIFDAFKAGASGYLLKDTSREQGIAAIREAVYYGGMLLPARVARKTMQFFTDLPGTRDYRLTRRETEVLTHMCNGISNRNELADTLFISYQTVNNHLRNIYDKLHVHSAAEAVAKAFRERLTPWRNHP